MPNVAGHIGPHHPETNEDPAGQASDFASVERALERIQTRVEAKFTRLERLIVTVFDRPLEPTEVIEALELCDGLGTKLGMLGFGVSAELLRRTATQLDQDDLGLPACMAMSSMLEDARIAMTAVIEESRVMSRNGSTLAVVGDESETLDDIMWVAASRGLRITRVVEGMETGRQDAAAIVLAAGHPDLSRVRPLVRGLRERYPLQPFVLLTPPGEISDRLSVVDLVTTVMPLAARPTAVIDEVRGTLARAAHELSVIVLGEQADWVAGEMAHRGLAARSASGAEDVLSALRSGTARSVLLLPGQIDPNPNEMLRTIRTDRSLRSSIVGIVGETMELRDPALRDGADAFFSAQTDLDDVAVTLKMRLRRRAEIEPLADPDVHQQSIPWANASVLIERMLTSAFRQSTPMGLALLRIPREVAGPNLDDQIAREFRQDDVIARRDDQSLVLALQGVGRRTIRKRLEDVHDKFGLTDLGVRSVGAEFPVDGRSLNELLAQNQIAVDRIQSEGGPAVAGADWQPEVSQAADVFLVDPDATLAAVLVPTLERRGLRVHYAQDSIDALDHLTGHAGKPLPAVVLLELDLQGFDGLHFLRQMREAGTLARVRVIVLTARIAENDLLQAFDLGADDYVTKPFSTPLLMHRLDRALKRR